MEHETRESSWSFGTAPKNKLSLVIITSLGSTLFERHRTDQGGIVRHCPFRRGVFAPALHWPPISCWAHRGWQRAACTRMQEPRAKIDPRERVDMFLNCYVNCPRRDNANTHLRCILDFERRRYQRQGSEFFLGK